MTVDNNTLYATGVKNSGASSQNPEAGLEVVNASENAVGNTVHPRYLSLLSASCKQKTKMQNSQLMLLIPALQASKHPFLTSWQKRTIIKSWIQYLKVEKEGWVWS